MRWRDVKKGHIKIKKDLKAPSVYPKISPVIIRIKAFLTDSFMIFMPVIYIVFYVIMGSREEFKAHMLAGWIYIMIPHFLITSSFLYFKNQTPGYKAYDLKLVTFKGKKPSFLQITIRYIVFTLTIAVFPLLFFPFFTKKRYGLYDIISRTLPIYSK